MNDSEVRSMLAQLLAGSVTDEQVDLLFAHIDGRRLALCLCIDMSNNRIDKLVVAKLIGTIKANLGSASRQFAAALDSIPDGHALRCIRPEYGISEGYVRVVAISSFINFYMRQYVYNSQDPVDIAEVKRIYFSDSLDGQPLGDIKRCWSGKFGIVWVFRDSYFLGLREKESEHLADILNDALGLGYKSSPHLPIELAVVRYPPNFPIPAAQPTTFDADWDTEDGFYMSIKSRENWGKTCSCTGSREGCEERVHRELAGGLSDEFIGVYVGRTNGLTPDADSVLKEGFRRLKDNN